MIKNFTVLGSTSNRNALFELEVEAVYCDSSGL